MNVQSRYTNQDVKLMKQMKFSNDLNEPVDISKVKLCVIKPWIVKNITDILGWEDDVLVEFIINQLEEKKFPDPKLIQVNLTGFLNGKNARIFMQQLWKLLVSAQKSERGIPHEMLEQKKEEIRLKMKEHERVQKVIDRYKTKMEPKESQKRSNKRPTQNTDYKDDKKRSKRESSREKNEHKQSKHKKSKHKGSTIKQIEEKSQTGSHSLKKRNSSFDLSKKSEVSNKEINLKSNQNVNLLPEIDPSLIEPIKMVQNTLASVELEPVSRSITDVPVQNKTENVQQRRNYRKKTSDTGFEARLKSPNDSEDIILKPKVDIHSNVAELDGVTKSVKSKKKKEKRKSLKSKKEKIGVSSGKKKHKKKKEKRSSDCTDDELEEKLRAKAILSMIRDKNKKQIP